MALVSRNVRFMRIFSGIPWRGASNDSAVIKASIFMAFGWYVFGTVGNEANIFIQYYLVVVAFPPPEYIMTFNGLAWPFYVKSSLLRTGLFIYLL